MQEELTPLEAAAPEAGPLALSYPVDSPAIAAPYGQQVHPLTGESSLHRGVDFLAAEGEPVRAAADGTVAAAGLYAGLGNVVAIIHGQVDGAPVTTWYAHNSEVKVAPGQAVKRGEVIALVGSTGQSTGPHLHFEVRVGGEPVDPSRWLAN